MNYRPGINNCALADAYAARVYMDNAVLPYHGSSLHPDRVYIAPQDRSGQDYCALFCHHISYDIGGFANKGALMDSRDLAPKGMYHEKNDFRRKVTLSP